MNETVVAVCSMIKDEQNYLKEWIEYHLNIGISCIYLYEDDINNSSSHANICKEYQNVYLDKFTNMVVLNGRKVNKQCELWNAFISKYRNDIDYVAFIDIDEFIAFGNGYSLNDLIEDCDKRGATILPWKCYGANGLEDNLDYRVVETFTKEAADFFDPNAYKSFAKLKGSQNKEYMLNHHLHSSLVGLENSKTNLGKYYLKHYITKSFKEYYDKLTIRGDIMNTRRIKDFFRYNQDMINRKDELIKKYGRYDTKTIL